MKYTKEKFLTDVAKEAKALKKNANKEELANLDFDRLDVTHLERCIYGQVGGNCAEGRGLELIEKCCTRYVDLHGVDEICDNGFIAIKNHINGTMMPRKRNSYSIGWLSSIESYIAMPNAKNKNLIDFLKGERKDLVL